MTRWLMTRLLVIPWHGADPGNAEVVGNPRNQPGKCCCAGCGLTDTRSGVERLVELADSGARCLRVRTRHPAYAWADRTGAAPRKTELSTQPGAP